MKFFAVFAAIVAVACGAPTSWNINQLSEAIQSPHTNAAYLPYLEEALNEMMAAAYAGETMDIVTVTIPTIEVPSMSLAQISDAFENPETNPALVPYLEEALNQMMNDLVSGQPTVAAASTSVSVPATEISIWTLFQLSDALQNPSTNPALVPYLEDALNQLMESLVAGEQVDFVVIGTPVGTVTVEAEAPAAVVPVMPTPIEVAPVSPAPAVPTTPAAPSSPLVQIIINIKQQEASVVAPVVDAQPEPINIVEQPLDVPEAINVVEQAPLAPEPIIIVEEAPIAAVPIGVVGPSTPIAVVPIGIVAPA